MSVIHNLHRFIERWLIVLPKSPLPKSERTTTWRKTKLCDQNNRSVSNNKKLQKILQVKTARNVFDFVIKWNYILNIPKCLFKTETRFVFVFLLKNVPTKRQEVAEIHTNFSFAKRNNFYCDHVFLHLHNDVLFENVLWEIFSWNYVTFSREINALRVNYERTVIFNVTQTLKQKIWKSALD